MAGAGGRRNTSRGVKDKNAAADRARIIKKLNAYYIRMRKKHGLTGVRLNFSNSKKKGYAGLYKYAKGGKSAEITVVLPEAKNWADSENAAKGSPRIKPTTALAEGKKIINAEVAHHVDVMEHHGGGSPKRLKIFGVTIKKGRDAHGATYRRAIAKVGGRPGGIKKKKDLRQARPKLGRNRSTFGQA